MTIGAEYFAYFIHLFDFRFYLNNLRLLYSSLPSRNTIFIYVFKLNDQKLVVVEIFLSLCLKFHAY